MARRILVTGHASHVTFKTGARGQIRTGTGDVLNVVPLLVGLRELGESEDGRWRMKDGTWCDWLFAIINPPSSL